MVRHSSGTLFPYNPEFYDLASSLYGPGAKYCWLLLLASVVLTWIFHPSADYEKEGPGMSNDLWAVLAYPTFAATDALVQAMKLRGTEHRALAYFCLRYPEAPLNWFGEFNHTQLDLRDEVPPDILSLGQKVIDLTGPVSVCYMFLVTILVMASTYAICQRLRLPQPPERIESPCYPSPTALEGQREPPNASSSAPSGLNRVMHKLPRFGSTIWAVALACIAWAYVALMLTICILSLGNRFASFMIVLYELFMPFYLIFVLFASLAFAAVIILLSIKSVRLCIQQEWQTSLKMLQALGLYLLVGALGLGTFYLELYFQPMSVSPDLGIAVTERDQLATLIVGVATLGYTVYGICYPRRPQVPSEEIELLQVVDNNV